MTPPPVATSPVGSRPADVQCASDGHTTACTIWVGRLDEADLADARGLLNEDERARAGRYRDVTARERFELGASMVRRCAARALGIPARDVVVDRTCNRCGEMHGRPRVVGSGLELSVSHSGDLVLVAVSDGAPIGVDVEDIAARGPFDHTELAMRVCDPTERPHVGSLRDFLVYWTRKEALLKASGEGLRVPPVDVVVTPPGLPPAVVAWRGRPRPGYQMTNVDLGPGQVASLAVLTTHPITVAVLSDQELKRT